MTRKEWTGLIKGMSLIKITKILIYFYTTIKHTITVKKIV
jgi:hypothetical protein